MRATCLVLVPLLCLTPTNLQADVPRADSSPYQQESTSQRDARMKWFRQARFGMFIHWGLYSVAAGEWRGKPSPGAGEWIMNDMTIPLSQYRALVPQFNPVKFDARQWVRIAKGAGMKYIVITTKHHDGFAIYPSQLTDWCIKSSPFGRDPLTELAAACKEEGITLCFYHSIMDWHHPDYAPRKPWNDIATSQADFERYVDFMKGELRELLTNYGPIGILWFDGNWESTWNFDRGADLYTYVRSLQPQIIVNNRVGQDRKGVAGTADGQERIGDYGTPEQQIPATGYGPGVDWETCMTMNDTWGFKKQDHHWKSTQTLIRNLIDTSSKGGNYLLNVGPTGEGLIPEASVQRLKEVGDWMQINGEAVYATTASPFKKQLPWGRCTQKATPADTTLYLHVFDWPTDGKLLVPGLKDNGKARLLADTSKKTLETEMTDDGLLIALPKDAPDAVSSTIELQVAGTPHIEPVPITQEQDGSIALQASEAQLHGKTLQYEVGGPLDDIGFWSNPADWAEWEFKVRKPGRFKVVAVIGAPESGTFDVCVGEKSIHCTSPATASYIDFKLAILGTVDVPSPGRTRLSVRPDTQAWKPMNLKSIHLIPVAMNQ
jgi:alpha-L-fucosidase